MRRFGKYAVWIVISLVMQYSILLFLNNYYLKDEKNLKITAVNSTAVKQSPTPTPTPKPKVTIPAEAKNLQMSYDGKYVSYDLDSNVQILNLETKETLNFEKEKNSTQLYYNWMDGTNRIVIAEKLNVNEKYIVKFYYYDVKDKEKLEVKDFINNKEVSIALTSKDAQISKISFNTMNTIIYPKITLNNTSTIYRVDSSAPIEKISTQTSKIGNVEIVKQLDRIIYEDQANKKVFLAKEKVPYNIQGVSKYRLLAADNSGNVYLGEEQNEKITKIHYGQPKDTVDKWKSISLEQAVDAKDISVSAEGVIFVNDNLTGTVTDLISSKTAKYSGKLVGIYSKGILTVEDDVNLVKYDFK